MNIPNESLTVKSMFSVNKRVIKRVPVGRFGRGDLLRFLRIKCSQKTKENSIPFISSYPQRMNYGSSLIRKI